MQIGSLGQEHPLEGRAWHPTPVFLPRESHAQRSLEGYSPWGRKRVRHNLATKQQQVLPKCLFLLLPPPFLKGSHCPKMDK